MKSKTPVWGISTLPEPEPCGVRRRILHQISNANAAKTSTKKTWSRCSLRKTSSWFKSSMNRYSKRTCAASPAIANAFCGIHVGQKHAGGGCHHQSRFEPNWEFLPGHCKNSPARPSRCGTALCRLDSLYTRCAGCVKLTTRFGVRPPRLPRHAVRGPRPVAPVAPCEPSRRREDPREHSSATSRMPVSILASSRFPSSSCP